MIFCGIWENFLITQNEKIRFYLVHIFNRTRQLASIKPRFFSLFAEQEKFHIQVLIKLKLFTRCFSLSSSFFFPLRKHHRQTSPYYVVNCHRPTGLLFSFALDYRFLSLPSGFLHYLISISDHVISDRSIDWLIKKTHISIWCSIINNEQSVWKVFSSLSLYRILICRHYINWELQCHAFYPPRKYRTETEKKSLKLLRWKHFFFLVWWNETMKFLTPLWISNILSR